ncbi:hypothetical protein OH779_22370 [Actinacidiphila glaucinigra]|uniref:hypothetical protein n=1 Tax=Actinacidiphila glaucinigra TaxID=235986 RepID=UPI00386A421F
MSKLITVPEELEASFYRFLAAETTRTGAARVTPVFALRAAFRMYLRDEDQPVAKVTDAQFIWLLDEANIPTEEIPLRTGPVVPHACGIRLSGEYGTK